MFTIMALGIHFLSAEMGIVNVNAFWIPGIGGLIYDMLFLFVCVSVLTEF